MTAQVRRRKCRAHRACRECRANLVRRSANGASHTSLGHRPRIASQTKRGLKARPIAHANVHGSGFQPSGVFHHESWGVAPGWYGDGPLALNAPNLGARHSRLACPRRTWELVIASGSCPLLMSRFSLESMTCQSIASRSISFVARHFEPTSLADYLIV